MIELPYGTDPADLYKDLDAAMKSADGQLDVLYAKCLDALHEEVVAIDDGEPSEVFDRLRDAVSVLESTIVNRFMIQNGWVAHVQGPIVRWSKD